MDNNNMMLIVLITILITFVVCVTMIENNLKEETQLFVDLSVINQGDNITITLTDSKGQPLANKTVHVTINGVTYNLTTDYTGKTQLAINLNSNHYTINVKFDGDSNKYKSSEISHKIFVQEPPKETQNTDSDSSSGDVLVWINEYGDKVYQRKDGSVYGISANGEWWGSANSLEDFLKGPY